MEFGVGVDESELVVELVVELVGGVGGWNWWMGLVELVELVLVSRSWRVGFGVEAAYVPACYFTKSGYNTDMEET